MNKLIIKGKVWKFGDKVDTDVITSGKYLNLSIQEMSSHTLETLNPRFPKEVQRGDLIVAGQNFGCGSSRETAPAALKYLGVGAIVAQSFARIFFRNALAIGLPIISCPSIDERIKEGDNVEVDFYQARLTDLNNDISWQANPLSEEMLQVLEGGGIVPLMKKFA